MLEKTRDGASSVVSRTSSFIYNTAGESLPSTVVYKAWIYDKLLFKYVQGNLLWYCADLNNEKFFCISIASNFCNIPVLKVGLRYLVRALMCKVYDTRFRVIFV
jgi:hypothetical protein